MVFCKSCLTTKQSIGLLASLLLSACSETHAENAVLAVPADGASASVTPPSESEISPRPISGSQPNGTQPKPDSGADPSPQGFQRTIVFILAPTKAGQDLFIRGGLDHEAVSVASGTTCTNTAETSTCAIPIRHTHQFPATAGDSFLDWYGPETGQPAGFVGSKAIWTTNTWPSAWGPQKTVAANGVGLEPLNVWGSHYWMLDVQMDCSRAYEAPDGTRWFEIKTFVQDGAGWESNVAQPDSPYLSGNHFARCGTQNLFYRNENTAAYAASSLVAPSLPETTTGERCPVAPLPREVGRRTLYVAVNGDDRSGDGTLAKPFASLAKAAKGTRPGDTVLVKSGTYKLQNEQYIQATGAPGLPITFRPAPGETVVLDGQEVTVPNPGTGLLTLKGEHLVFDGFEIANARTGGGLHVFESQDVVIRRCSVHDTKYAAIWGNGTRVVLQSNHVWNAVLSNEKQAVDRARGGFGWAGAMYSDDGGQGHQSLDWTVEDNHVHDCWGECFVALRSERFAIRGNRFHDCYSANVYVDDARSVRIDRNYIYDTTDKYNRPSPEGRAHGIVLGNEDAAGALQIGHVTVANNLVLSTTNGIVYAQWGRLGYNDLHIFNNVFSDTRKVAIWIAQAPVATGGIIRNNIIYKGADGGTIGGGIAGWTIDTNVFPTGNPVGSTGVVRDPMFVGQGPGGTEPEKYNLQPNSPLVGTGAPVGDALVDFACMPRDPEKPTPGIYETPSQR